MNSSPLESRPGIYPWAITILLLLIGLAPLPSVASDRQGGRTPEPLPVNPMLEVVLSGAPTGQVDLPPGTVVKQVSSGGRYLAVVAAAGVDSDLLLFQSNPKPRLRLLWKRKLAGAIRSVQIRSGSLWIVTEEASPRLLELSLKTGNTENVLTLPQRTDGLDEGSDGLADEGTSPSGAGSENRTSRPVLPQRPITIALLQTEPAAAVVLDARKPRRLEIFTGFLHMDEGFHFRDVGGDDVLGIACLGDSNTFSMDNRGWCEQLSFHIADPRFRTVNYASIGGQALGSLPRDGDLQLATALREPSVDLVIASFGINDLRQGATPQELLAKYQSMAARTRRAGKQFLPTTVAPYRGPLPDTAAHVQEFNQLLRDAFGQDAVIEFFGELPADTLHTDGVHLTPKGHDLRREAALPHLYGTITCKRGTPCAAPRICFHEGNSERIKQITGQAYSVLRGFLPQAACVRPTDLKKRVEVAKQAAEVVWTASLQEKMETDRLEFEEKCMISKECFTSGNCGAIAIPGSGNAFECRPSRNLHCLESLACQNQNRCVSWFGECIEEPEETQQPDGPASLETDAND